MAQGTLALILIDDKKLNDAASAADEAVATDPYSAVGWYAVSQVAKKQKNSPRALEALAKAAEYDASWLPVRMAYADELLGSKGADAAAKALNEYQAVSTMAGDFLSPNEGEVARARKQVLALKKVVK